MQALAALLLCYAAAVLLGTAIPVHWGWHEAREGVRIWVIDNGIHTDIVLPRTAIGIGWDDLLQPADIADPAQAANSHIAFGWGDRDFYLNTPTWADVNPLRVGRAMIGAGETVMHVAHIPQPQAGPHARTLVLAPDEYRRLVAAIRDSFGEGAPVHGYGASDAFYVARGGYSLLHTCNGWTGAALRKAGVKMGVWTPFPFGVMLWL
ncbi:TIGR02117 family protein [Sphingomonas sp. MMS12-HWE2-04]|uniref:TIGR02117 family protein n=1 Tax=Sphingomonas sp. MMS12-HWE2-04 TaxID=3234199 RepID=UPI00384F0293